MKLEDFSGCLNTRVAPHLLSTNEAVIYDNIEHSSGAIVPVKDHIKLSETANKSFTFFETNDEFVSTSYSSSWVEYRNELYSTENDGVYKYDGNNKYNLSIEKPDNKPIIALDAPGRLNGTYSYLYTYYNKNEDIESSGSTISEEIEVENRSVVILDLKASTDPQVTHIRLYRLGGTLQQYSLVDELPNDDSSYKDTKSDSLIAGNEVYDNATYGTPPKGLKYLTMAYAMFFGAYEDKLYYSNIAQPNQWPVTNFIDFDDTVTGIGIIQSGIIVTTKYRTHIITGNSPSTLSKFIIDSSVGCVNHYTMKSVKNTLLWVSNDGVCACSGAKVEILSQKQLGNVKLTTKNAVVKDNIYYLLCGDYILCFDFRYNAVVRKLPVTGDWLAIGKNDLYLSRNTDLYKMFASEKYAYMSYKSPILTNGSYTNRKVYKDIYINYNGDLRIDAIIDGKNAGTINLSGEGVYNMKTAVNKEGYGISFHIQGRGIVNSIEYLVEGRQ